VAAGAVVRAAGAVDAGAEAGAVNGGVVHYT
jgi:hypothetical protein